MLAAAAREALWFLPFVAPVAIWVAWSDMKFMKIPNKAVLALAGVFATIGLLAVPLPEYGWRWMHLAVVLAIGFVLTIAGAMGAGDAKFAAAMAPFVALGDARLFIGIFAASLLAAFAAHRLMRAVPAFRAATPDWASWTHAKFPMGLALSGALLIHLGAVAMLGR
ncbi:MAG: prepilin peptidase [Gemmobacter sp.]|uniref:prepilin peptidase n=1 Tax=Gemmobacter sp. TaxID=1898957 RepID=UPI00391982EE